MTFKLSGSASDKAVKKATVQVARDAIEATVKDTANGVVKVTFSGLQPGGYLIPQAVERELRSTLAKQIDRAILEGRKQRVEELGRAIRDEAAKPIVSDEPDGAFSIKRIMRLTVAKAAAAREAEEAEREAEEAERAQRYRSGSNDDQR